MKKILPILFAISSLSSFAQYDRNFALGLRIGEPLGLNIRKYFQGGDKAFDINVGTYGLLWRNQVRYLKGEYNGAGFGVQGIYSWHRRPFSSNNFHVYYGFGGQVNNRNHYPDDRIGERNNKERKLSLGPAGIAGFEFDIPSNDLAFFMEVGSYLEVLPRPLFWHPTGALGVRLNLIR